MSTQPQGSKRKAADVFADLTPKEGDPAPVLAILSMQEYSLSDIIDGMTGEQFGIYRSHVMKQKNMDRIIDHHLTFDVLSCNLEVS